MNSTVAETTPVSSSKALHWVLWGVQVLLAAAFLMAGLFKATSPLADLATKMTWVPQVPEALVRFIGVSEIAGALGLVLPSLTRVLPKLTVWAALALWVVMVLAALLHGYLGEWQALPVNIVLGGLAALVAWGRNSKAAISPRS